MTLRDYLIHYLSPVPALLFLLVSLVIVLLVHGIFHVVAGKKALQYRKSDQVYAEKDMYILYTEHFYELFFSASSTLFFTGVYFLIDFDYFHMSPEALAIWGRYNEVILLGFLVINIVIMNILDHFLIPLRRISEEEISTLRMAGMIYMLIVFAYIKFIYEDNNYDIILFYFVTMLVGRFVYLDASFKSFQRAILDMVRMLPILGMVLAATGLLALYGFLSGYLLRSNGVVLSLFIAHCYAIVEIFFLRLFRPRHHRRR